MGYFNIFYKITRIIDMLTRKRNRRAIMVILIIIAVIFILHNKGYCAQEDSTYTTDTNYFIIEEYDAIMENIRAIFNNKYQNPNDATYTYFNEIFTRIQNGWYPYFYKYNENAVRIYFYNGQYDKTLVDTSLVYNDYMRVPSTAYNVTIPIGSDIYVINLSQGYIGYFQSTIAYNAPIPQILLYKIPSQINDIMERAGYAYSGQNVDLQAIKDKLDLTNGKLDRLDEDITDPYYDESEVTFNTSAVDNINDSEITGLFTSVVSSFQNELRYYGGTITKVIPLPHGGQIEIPSNIVSSHLGNLTALVEAFWYFVFGIYLFRFVSNIIHKIKTGDILNGYTNDNEIITSSML